MSDDTNDPKNDPSGPPVTEPEKPPTPEPAPRPAVQPPAARAARGPQMPSVEVILLDENRGPIETIRIDAPAPFRFRHNGVHYEQCFESPSGVKSYAPVR